MSYLCFGEHTCDFKSYLRFAVLVSYLRLKNARTCENNFASMVKIRKYGVIPCDVGTEILKRYDDLGMLVFLKKVIRDEDEL